VDKDLELTNVRIFQGYAPVEFEVNTSPISPPLRLRLSFTAEIEGTLQSISNLRGHLDPADPAVIGKLASGLGSSCCELSAEAEHLRAQVIRLEAEVTKLRSGRVSGPRPITAQEVIDTAQEISDRWYPRA
jgi:hypothetical protein